MADQTGNERQSAGPEILDDRGHERTRQGLLERPACRGVLGFVPVGDDHVRDPLLCEAVESKQRDLAHNSHRIHELAPLHAPEVE